MVPIAVVRAMGRWFSRGRLLPRTRLRLVDSTKYRWSKDTMEAYCVKCKAKVEIKDPQSITMKNGRPATTGSCPKCSTKVFRIGATS